MAAPVSVGKSECHDCGESVHVAINGGGFAYYRCGGCGFEGRHHWHTSSKRYLDKRVKLRAEVSGEKPEKPAPAAAVKPAAPVPEKPAKSGFSLSSLTGGA